MNKLCLWTASLTVGKHGRKRRHRPSTERREREPSRQLWRMWSERRRDILVPAGDPYEALCLLDSVQEFPVPLWGLPLYTKQEELRASSTTHGDAQSSAWVGTRPREHRLSHSWPGASAGGHETGFRLVGPCVAMNFVLNVNSNSVLYFTLAQVHGSTFHEPMWSMCLRVPLMLNCFSICGHQTDPSSFFPSSLEQGGKP